jgi:hypothetical protein
MTGTSVITGTGVRLAALQNVSFQAVWTGTPTGVFSFEVSNDVVNKSEDVVNWTAYTVPSTFTSGSAAPAGSAGSFVFEFYLIPVRWIRPKYTNASGTGTLFVQSEAK